MIIETAPTEAVNEEISNVFEAHTRTSTVGTMDVSAVANIVPAMFAHIAQHIAMPLTIVGAYRITDRTNR